MSKILKYIVTIVIIAVAIIMNMAGEEDVPADLQVAEVAKIMDGDTIGVYINGEYKKVRFVGINTPEISGDEEIYGYASKDYTSSVIPKGTTIYLSKDVSDTDKYDRLLRLIWLEKPDAINEDTVEQYTLNALLLKEGYAQARKYEPDLTYYSLFKRLNEEAISNNLGVYKMGYK